MLPRLPKVSGALTSACTYTYTYTSHAHAHIHVHVYVVATTSWLTYLLAAYFTCLLSAAGGARPARRRPAREARLRQRVLPARGARAVSKLVFVSQYFRLAVHALLTP